MRKGFNKEEGPFVRALDRALSSFNVEHQAYYSGTFVSNHVHRTLTVHGVYMYMYCMEIHCSVCTRIVILAQFHYSSLPIPPLCANRLWKWHNITAQPCYIRHKKLHGSFQTFSGSSVTVMPFMMVKLSQMTT